MMKRLAYLLSLGALLHAAPACMDDGAADSPDDNLEDQDNKADISSTTPVVTDDQLNGLWRTSAGSSDLVIESWSAIGIRLHGPDGNVIQLARTGDELAGDGVQLAIHPNKAGIRDDSMDGTIAGQTVHLTRDTAVKPPITLAFPGDRPYRVWLQDTIMPMAQQDRESFKHFTHSPVMSFLYSCELYRHGSWLNKYMKGDTYQDKAKSFANIIYAMDYSDTTPHAIVGNYKFQTAVKANLKDQSQIGLALSSFGMYFSTAAGGALRLPITSDSTAYFITDRPARAALLGLVVMKTPAHGPLASTFGRQLLDLGAMQASDSSSYARAMMELLVKSSNKSASLLSGTGRSALTDWYSVMAIEDYRGVAFGDPGLGWGYNMTNGQFYGLVVRALARPGQLDSAGHPILGQVIVGSTLQPGDPSYADVLNGGNDMQEYPDMSRLKTLATSFLRQYHTDAVQRVQNAFANIVPASELDWRAQSDIFHFITAQLYDSQGRTSKLVGAQADDAIEAVVGLLDTLNADRANFETYILQNGVTQSNMPAPRSTGF
ncbi:MAG: hypothetical protein ACM31C_16420 [Acidobacteriota bacterium]